MLLCLWLCLVAGGCYLSSPPIFEPFWWYSTLKFVPECCAKQLIVVMVLFTAYDHGVQAALQLL